MKTLLKLAPAALLMPCIAWSAPQQQTSQQAPDKIKSTRIVFTDDQVPQFVAVERKGKTYVVIDSNHLKTSLEAKKQ